MSWLPSFFSIYALFSKAQKNTMVALAGMTPKWGKTQVFFIFAVLGDQFNLQKAMLALWFPRCPIRKSIADTTGSICKSYSTMGNMELDDSENSIPLVIWLAYHLNHRTPLLVHENVRGFLSTILSDQAVEAGYEVCQAKCDPKDIGIPVGRPRKSFGQRIWSSFIDFPSFIYIYM